ncbi:hypothetical protein GC169_06770 [bacterium]|nr:hypothetical protein [bacterium]
MAGAETATDAAGAGAWLAGLGSMLAEPFLIGPDSRLFYMNFIVFIACGAAVYWLHARRPGDATNVSGSGPLGFIFPAKMYLSRSSLVDLKIYIANHFVSFKAAGVKLVSISAIAAATASVLEPVLGGLALDGQAFWALALCALMMAMANDFATYVTHRLTHENKALWPFHRVHHSAEVLTPLTLYRKHPVYSFISSLIQPLIAGPVIGVIAVVFDQHGVWTIMGVNAVYMMFNFVGANLRHSHIWIEFGPVLSRVFISPAMHQIHHSIDPKHYDRNYGEVFALWDWMFGTIYIPNGREEISFGVVDNPGATGASPAQPHPTLKDAYLEPIRAFARELSGREDKGAADDPPVGVRAA